MPRPCSTLVSLDDTPWYHCVAVACAAPSCAARIASRAGTSSTDAAGSPERVKQFAAIFAINVAGYAVMSNHYYIVLRLLKEFGTAVGAPRGPW